MSMDDLLDAYQLGCLVRRAFVRALIDQGISQRAAARHAVALRSMTGTKHDNVVGGSVDEFDDDLDDDSDA
jgi:hypothetical protein